MTEPKNYLKQGFSFFLYALPLLFGAPVLITIGFKALKHDGNLAFLTIGFILAIVAMILLSIAVKRILQHLFNQ